MCSNLCTSLYKVCTIYISLLKINKINFITVLFIKFLKNRAAGHWIKSLSIVCSQNTESTHLQESVFPSAFGFREDGFLQVCTFPYSGNKQWITDSISDIQKIFKKNKLTQNTTGQYGIEKDIIKQIQTKQSEIQ